MKGHVLKIKGYGKVTSQRTRPDGSRTTVHLGNVTAYVGPLNDASILNLSFECTSRRNKDVWIVDGEVLFFVGVLRRIKATQIDIFSVYIGDTPWSENLPCNLGT
jgi:hypothetical protein